MQQLKQHKIFLYILIFLMTITIAVPIRAFAGDGASQSVKIYYKNLNAPMAVIELTDADGATQTFDQLKIKGANNYLSASLSLGEYTYKVYKDAAKSTVVASGNFTVTSSTTNLYVCYIDVKVDYQLSAKEWSDYEPGGTVTVKDQKGHAITPGNIYFNSTTEHHEYVTVVSTLPAVYTYDIKPKDSKIEKGSGTISFTGTLSLQWASASDLVPLKRSATFYVTKGAPLDVYSKGKEHYVSFTKYEPTNIDKSSDPKYDIYKYTLPVKKLFYIAGGGDSGFQKQGRDITYQGSDAKTFKVDLVPRDNEKREDSGYLEANLYLNVPDSKYEQLAVGESFKLEAFRVWQAVTSTTENCFIEPEYHYEVIGDSVELTDGGSTGRQYKIVKGLKKGISIIKITYDAMDWKDQFASDDANSVDNQYYNAIDPVNTGIVIVSVDGNNTANIQTNIKQTEYDTIYYTSSINGVKQDKQYAEYTFKPTAKEELSVRVHDPLHKTTWGEAWTSYEPNSDGFYTVHLKEGRNIVEVSAGESVQYYVVNAKGLEINIENETNQGQPLKVGDMVKISFKGLSQPIQKMAGIYNPGFPGTCWVQYETEKGRVVQSPGTQYDVIVKNDIEFILTEAGMIKLVNGCIHAGHLGSELGTHRNIPDTGMLPNLNASSGSNSPYFSTLPTITLEVTDGKADEEQSKLTYAQLYNIRTKLGANEVAWNLSAASWNQLNELRNKAENWEGNPTTQALSIMPTTLNNDVKITARYYLQSNVGTFIEVADLNDSNTNQIIDSLNAGDIAYIEITITPKDASKGYPQTYTIRAANNTGGNDPCLTNLVLSPVNGKSDMDYLDGLLKPVAQGPLDLGYGFIPTRNEFTTHVPYSVDKITLTPTKLNADTIKINDSDVQSGTPSNEIKLSEGKNDITLICICGSKIVNYKISVIRDSKPLTVQIDTLKDSQLVIKNSKDNIVKVNEDATYSLPLGIYKYCYSKTGYLTATGSFTVTAETTVVTLPELQKVNQTYGDISVRAMAKDRILRDKTTISFTADTLLEKEHDLELQGYVSQNYGGYTALHALIDAFNTGISKVSFNCYKGVLIPNISIPTTGQGSNAGWVCEVNGKVCDPATTLVNNGDQIDFYYNPDYPGMKHAWFDKSAVTVTAGNSADVTLVAASVNNDGSTASGVEGATIKVNGTVAGVTKSGGGFNIPTEMIKDPGEYTITGEKIESGKNILTYAYAIVSVKKAGVEVTPGKTDVTFRLIGDAKHNGIGGHGKYVTWIATKKYSFDQDSVSVYEVFTKALKDAGLDQVGAERNYVSKIKAPKAYGGYWLAEFTNGQNSGWMYTVNGIHPKVGLKDCYVTTGDVIIWHYVDDYTLETSFEGSVPSYPNRWLEAEDEDPPTNGKIIDMSNGNQELVKEAGTASATVGIEAKVDAKGKATAFVEKKDITTAIQKVIQGLESVNGETPLKKIVIAISGTEKANTVEVTIPKASVAELDKDIDIVTVRTAVGEVSFDKNAFDTLAKDASGDLKLTITKVNAEQLVNEMKTVSETDQELIKNRPVFEFKAEVGSKTVSDFNGKVTVTIPYEKKDKEQVEGLLAYWLQDNGQLSPVLTSKANSDGKSIEMTTTHWSKYVIGYRDIHFADTEKHWADSNIRYLAARDVIKGKEDNCFVPNNQITRAEFVQILANLSGADLSSFKKEGATAFTDVAANAWYAESAEWAKNQGIAEGANGLFNPNANISREDMAVMITRYVSKVNKEIINSSGGNVTFIDDAKISNYAKEAVMAMQKAGIINGVQNNLGSYTFNPKANATRAEAATMMANYMKH